MPARAFPTGIARLVLLLGCLFQAGCGMRIASVADRRASFAPYRQGTIESESLSGFLARRTALVIGGDGLMVVAKPPSTRTGRFPMKGVATRFGAAAAIDARGYFLTASHTFESKAPFLAYHAGDGLQVVPSRIVWRGNISKDEPDLAILRVPKSLEATFNWAPNPGPGPLAFAAGFNSGKATKFQLAFLAGRVTEVAPRADGRPISTDIFHFAPLHPGDSGGPLATPDGRLLGINTQVELSIFRSKPLGMAERPDLTWLRNLIDQDAARPY